jgi:hypothetical protein
VSIGYSHLQTIMSGDISGETIEMLQSIMNFCFGGAQPLSNISVADMMLIYVAIIRIGILGSILGVVTMIISRVLSSGRRF